MIPAAEKGNRIRYEGDGATRRQPVVTLDDEAIKNAPTGVLGDVRERVVTNPSAWNAASLPSTCGFPEVFHRSELSGLSIGGRVGDGGGSGGSGGSRSSVFRQRLAGAQATRQAEKVASSSAPPSAHVEADPDHLSSRQALAEALGFASVA